MAPQKIYRALEGGGVRGIAHIGAAAVFDTLPDHYNTIANVGTSAGSEAGALLSAGLSPEAAKAAIDNFPFSSAIESGLETVPLIGTAIEGERLIRAGGLHDGSRLQAAVEKTLQTHAGISSFGDLNRLLAAGKPGAAKLYIVAHDVANGQVVFPDAYSSVYGIHNPAEQSIAFAARASSSIPGFFAPAQLRDAKGQVWDIADGGVDALLPYDVAQQLATEHDPGARVINFALGDPGQASPIGHGSPVAGVEYIAKLVRSVATARRDALLRDKDVRSDSVIIDTDGIKTTDFNLSKAQQTYLYNSGIVSAMEFVTRDLGTAITRDEAVKLSVLATAARSEITSISAPGRGVGGVTEAMTNPLMQRLDVVSRQLGGVASPAPRRAELTVS